MYYVVVQTNILHCLNSNFWQICISKRGDSHNIQSLFFLNNTVCFHWFFKTAYLLTGPHFCGRQQWQRENPGSRGRAAEDGKCQYLVKCNCYTWSWFWWYSGNSASHSAALWLQLCSALAQNHWRVRTFLHKTWRQMQQIKKERLTCRRCSVGYSLDFSKYLLMTSWTRMSVYNP